MAFFDPIQGLAVTTAFLKLGNGELGDIFLAKLQYLAERESLIRYSSPIVVDEPRAMQWGPILSETLTLTRSPFGNPNWQEFVEFNEHDGVNQVANTVTLKGQFPHEDELSKASLGVVTDVWLAHRHLIETGHRRMNPKWSPAQGFNQKGLQKAGYLLHDWCKENCPEYVKVWDNHDRGSYPIPIELIFELGKGLTALEAKDQTQEMFHHIRFERLMFDGDRWNPR